jgi:hypothetical protein
MMCGGIGGVSCATGYYEDSAKAGTAATSSTKNTACCTAKATCTGYSCSAGYTLKASPGNIMGTGATSSLSNSMCCDTDATKCLGIGSVVCATGYYEDSTKAGTAATATYKNTVCCTAKATCTGYSCSAGYTLKASPGNIMGTGDTSTLSTGTCCDNDVTKCFGIGSVVCATGYYEDSAKAGTAATATDKNTVCCTAKATCTGYSCSAGYKLKASPGNIMGTGGTSTLSTTTCCDVDATTCGGIGGVTCPTGYYADSAKYGTAATATTKDSVCCTARATCQGYSSCSTGMNVEAIRCTTDTSSCGNAGCCVSDAITCGGVGGVTCATGYYEDSAKAGTAASSSTKNTACCTAKATCTGYSCSAGFKLRATPGSIMGTTGTSSLGNTLCCEADATTCAGFGFSGVTCATGYYGDSAKAGTAATATDKNTVCCTAKATCTGYSCSAGYTLKASPGNIMGTGDTSTLSTSTCCDIDVTKCFGIGSVVCATGYYEDSAKAGTAATASDKNTACCTAKATCTSYSCSAGTKLRASPGNIMGTMGSSTLGNTLCCEADATTCGGIGGVTCPTGYYADSGKYGTAATATNKDSMCCTARATCAAAYGGGSSAGGSSAGNTGSAYRTSRQHPAVVVAALLALIYQRVSWTIG